MITLLETIQQIPGVLSSVIANRKTTFQALLEAVDSRETPITQIILLGSGTSNTSGCTARYFAEQAGGLPVRAVIPNDFCYAPFHDPNALYLIISQTGTSIKTRECLDLIKDFGGLAAAMSETPNTPIAQAAEVYVDMGCGYEEHKTRTIGYSATVLTIMLLGLELGLRRGHLTQAQYDSYLSQAQKLPAAIERVIDDAMTWMDRSKWEMLHSDLLFFTGVNSLWGVAQEAACKVWELPKLASMGVDLDESMHGPNFGFNGRHCVLVLDDGRVDSQKAAAMVRYMKTEFKNGFMIGPDPVGPGDLKLIPQSGPFSCLEFAAAIQILAYRLAQDCGRDLQSPHDNSVMNSYFISHSDQK